MRSRPARTKSLPSSAGARVSSARGNGWGLASRWSRSNHGSTWASVLNRRPGGKERHPSELNGWQQGGSRQNSIEPGWPGDAIGLLMRALSWQQVPRCQLCCRNAQRARLHYSASNDSHSGAQHVKDRSRRTGSAAVRNWVTVSRRRSTPRRRLLGQARPRSRSRAGGLPPFGARPKLGAARQRRGT